MIWLLANRYVLVAIALVAATSGLWAHGKYRYHVGYQAAENVRHVADLESFKSESLRLHGLSQNLALQLKALREAQPSRPPIPANLASPCPAVDSFTSTSWDELMKSYLRLVIQYSERAGNHAVEIESWDQKH